MALEAARPRFFNFFMVSVASYGYFFCELNVVFVFFSNYHFLNKNVPVYFYGDDILIYYTLHMILYKVHECIYECILSKIIHKHTC